MNILFFVAIAAFYAIGSVLKAKANKSAKQKQAKRQPGVKPVERAPLRQPVKKTPPPATVKKPAYPQPAGRPVARPRPVMRKPLARKPAVPPKAVKPPAMAEAFPSVPSLQGELEGLRELPKRTVEQLDVGRLGLAAKKKEKELVIIEEPLLALDDPDALRRAIIYYEIIGKPVSMRRQGEHLIGL
jgi:hypothetical protein